MTDAQIVAEALALWGMGGAEYHLVAARENAVFKVTRGTCTHALRLHRKGYRTDTELRSELQWMAAAARGGLSVPAPIPSTSGDVLHGVAGVQVDMLTWLAGTPMGRTGEALATTDRPGLFYAIGREMARLHEVSDAWTPPTGFIRHAWDREGLLGETPLWGHFWNNPALSPTDRQLFLDLRVKADTDLARIGGTLDYGLIHADLVRENILIDGDRLHLIDFDDGGFGWRLFDLATALIKNLDEPDYGVLRAALIAGYTSIRPIDLAALDLFIVLRSATYVGWNMTRMGEEGAAVRNSRFIDATRHLACEYLTPARAR